MNKALDKLKADEVMSAEALAVLFRQPPSYGHKIEKWERVHQPEIWASLEKQGDDGLAGLLTGLYLRRP